MSDFVRAMLLLPPESFALLLIVCGLGFALMKSMAPIAGLAVVTFPFMLVSALATHVLMQDLPFVVRLDKGPALVLTTIAGMIAAVLAVVVVVRIGMVLHDLIGKRPELLDKDLLQKPD